jgi:hypothetical protein
MTVIDFKALGAKAAAEGVDQTKAVVGGSNYAPPAAGPGLARFVTYAEIGKQKGVFQGKPTVKEKVLLIFELVGKRHAVADDQQPHRITIEENYSLNEKANFFKLFRRMNYRQDAQHIVQLLGEGFKVEVVHDKWTDRTGKERVDAVLRTASGYTIAPPRKEDEDSETGWVNIEVPAAKSELRCFLWEQADLAQWGSLFIEGSYPERRDEKGVVTAAAKSKNVLQEKVLRAVNFEGSPIHTLLLANGTKIDLPSVGEDPDEREEGNGSGQQTTNPTGATGIVSGAAASSTTSPSDALTGIV